MYGGKQNQESAIQELIVSSTGNRLINRPECCNVQEIRNARTPIVKFFYKPIETQCDVAFSHGLGCENTMLIKYDVFPKFSKYVMKLIELMVIYRL